MNKNTGIQSAITNGTPVPPPQVRTTPFHGGRPAEQQKTDEQLAAARSDYDDNDPRSGWSSCSSAGLRVALLQSCPRPLRRSRGEDKCEELGARGADGGGDPVGDGDFSSRLRLGTDGRAHRLPGRSPLKPSRASGAPTSA
jgi:hypothetical protein